LNRLRTGSNGRVVQLRKYKDLKMILLCGGKLSSQFCYFYAPYFSQDGYHNSVARDRQGRRILGDMSYWHMRQCMNNTSLRYSYWHEAVREKHFTEIKLLVYEAVQEQHFTEINLLAYEAVREQHFTEIKLLACEAVCENSTEIKLLVYE
jgi:hypothetical protein